ncbi:MAG TPA: DegT/DnrJ/EryC1/StrS family aminotransferase, partial [Bacteroidia bacterium]
NSRLDSIQAAILSVKLKYLESFIEERRQVANFYDEALSGIDELILPKRDMNSTHVYNQYTVQLKSGDVEKLRSSLKELGIPTMKYYPEPLYNQKAYKQNITLEHTEKLCNTVFSLPIGTDMNEEQLNYITQNLIEIIKQK